MPLTCSGHGYYKLVKIFWVRPSPSLDNGPMCTCTLFLYRITEKVKQVAWMFVYQLVVAMGTTLWCRNFFLSLVGC